MLDNVERRLAHVHVAEKAAEREKQLLLRFAVEDRNVALVLRQPVVDQLAQQKELPHVLHLIGNLVKGKHCKTTALVSMARAQRAATIGRVAGAGRKGGELRARARARGAVARGARTLFPVQIHDFTMGLLGSQVEDDIVLVVLRLDAVCLAVQRLGGARWQLAR